MRQGRPPCGTVKVENHQRDQLLSRVDSVLDTSEVYELVLDFSGVRSQLAGFRSSLQKPPNRVAYLR